LLDVSQHLPDREAAHTVAAHGRILDVYAPESPRVPAAPAAVRLVFDSAYKPSGKAGRRDGIDLGRLLMAVVRRLSLLQYFYTGRRLDAPFAELKQAAGQVPVISHQLRREASRRYSARRRVRVDTSGLIGELDLDLSGSGSGAAAALWPYLYLGQWLGVGKNTSMGFGQYRLLPVPVD
jgi:hypothetical protein